MQDGVFRGAPNAIAQTSDGYIWIGTESELLRFDGVRFTRWTSPDGTKLPSLEIDSLLGARDGSLWIGTRAGLSHLGKWAYRQLFKPTGRHSRLLSRIMTE
jgi:ligand-binding sensor domain-containing protein